MRTKRKQVRLKNSNDVKYLFPIGTDKRKKPRIQIKGGIYNKATIKTLMRRIAKFEALTR